MTNAPKKENKEFSNILVVSRRKENKQKRTSLNEFLRLHGSILIFRDFVINIDAMISLLEQKIVLQQPKVTEELLA